MKTYPLRTYVHLVLLLRPGISTALIDIVGRSSRLKGAIDAL